MFVRFNSRAHYEINHDYSIDVPYFNLQMPGIELIKQYYANKYDAKLIICKGLGEFYDQLSIFLSNKHLILDKNYRMAFVIGGNTTHALPVIYIKEDNRECFLCADSLGTQIQFILPNIVTSGINRKISNLIQKNSPIQTYIVTEQRQADLYSCFIDALIFARDAVGKFENTREYRTPNLMFHLEQRAIDLDGYSCVKLPDELLKSSQISAFTLKHKEAASRVIYKNETLDMFRQRYSKCHQAKQINQYLQEKTVKFAYVIEIQFYLNQLEKIPNNSLSIPQRSAFICGAKKELSNQGRLVLNLGKKGLYDYALRFYKALSGEMSVSENKQSASHLSFFTSKTNGVKTAELLIDIIQDSAYWRTKSYYGLPTGIKKMQQELEQLASFSLEGKIAAIRTVAQKQKNPTKGFLYLFLGWDLQLDQLIVSEFYSIFDEDWQSSPHLIQIEKDWMAFNKKTSCVPLNELTQSQISITGL